MPGTLAKVSADAAGGAAGFVAGAFTTFQQMLGLSAANMAALLPRSSSEPWVQLDLIGPAAFLSMAAVLISLMGPTAARATTAATDTATAPRKAPTDDFWVNRPEVAAIFNMAPFQLELLDVYRPTYVPSKSGGTVHMGRGSSINSSAGRKAPEQLLPPAAAAHSAVLVKATAAAAAAGVHRSSGKGLAGAKGSCCVTEEEKALLEPKQCRAREWVYVR